MNGTTDRLAFAETPTFRRIHGFCRMRHDLGRMAVVIGPPGVGKSVALQDFAASFSPDPRRATLADQRGAYIAMTAESEGTATRTAQTIAAELLGRVPSNGPLLYRKLETACANIVGPVVIDEAQYLNARMLDTLRGIWDKHGTRFVFAGNPTFGTRFNRERESSLAQFASRVGAPLHIEGIQRGDVDAIGAANGVTDTDALDVLAFVAAHADLRAVELTVRAARMMGNPNAARTIRAAALDATGDAVPDRLPRPSRSATILSFPGRSNADGLASD